MPIDRSLSKFTAKMCLNKNPSASCKWIQHFQPNFCWVGPPYDFSLTWLQLRPWLQPNQSIQSTQSRKNTFRVVLLEHVLKMASIQQYDNVKLLGMPTSDHQSNPTPSCNGVSPGTFLVSTGKVTDTSQDQIQKPGSEEVRSVKWCWQKEKKDTYCRFKYPSIHEAVCYISICHLSVYPSPFFHHFSIFQSVSLLCF